MGAAGRGRDPRGAARAADGGGQAGERGGDGADAGGEDSTPYSDQDLAQDTTHVTAPDTITDMPALHVDVVAPVGAGDAFAAALLLSATLRGLPAAARLRHGHLMAAATLTVPGDLGTPPARADADRLAGLDGRAWERLRLGPGWTAAIEQEVRTR